MDGGAGPRALPGALGANCGGAGGERSGGSWLRAGEGTARLEASAAAVFLGCRRLKEGTVQACVGGERRLLRRRASPLHARAVVGSHLAEWSYQLQPRSALGWVNMSVHGVQHLPFARFLGPSSSRAFTPTATFSRAACSLPPAPASLRSGASVARSHACGGSGPPCQPQRSRPVLGCPSSHSGHLQAPSEPRRWSWCHLPRQLLVG